MTWQAGLGGDRPSGRSRAIDEFTVEGRLLTDVGGTIGAGVLSTPGMIGMMERTAAILSLEHLPEGKATVGFEVCIKHVAAAAEGAVCTRRRHACARSSTTASSASTSRCAEGERTIGVGTHERRVIEVGKLDAGTDGA